MTPFKSIKPHGGAALAGALARDAGGGQAGHSTQAGHGAHGALAQKALDPQTLNPSGIGIWGSET